MARPDSCAGVKVQLPLPLSTPAESLPPAGTSETVTARLSEPARAAAAREAPPEGVVAALAGILPDDVRVERLSVSYDDTISLEIRLVARDAAAWDLALERLTEAPSFEKVTPGPERREGEIRTSVSAQWRGGGR